MKLSIQVTSFLGCTLLFLGNSPLALSLPRIANASTMAQAQRAEQRLTVALPELAHVKLQDGSTVSGRVIDINTTSLFLQRNSQSREVKWETVSSSVQFDEEAIVRTEVGKYIIRGEENDEIQPPPTLAIPLNQISKLNPEIGHFQVDLSILPKRQIRGILQVASDHLYVVEQIAYNSEDNLFILQMKPYFVRSHQTSQ